MKVTKIAIDVGHNCPPDTGARGNGVQEDTVVREVADRVVRLLERDGIRVLHANPARANSVKESLRRRVTTANESDAGLYVSIHANSAASTAAKGTEVYYFGGNEVGKELATVMSAAIAKSITTTNRGAKDGSQYYVLRNTNMTAILVELGFLSNKSDAEKLKDSYDELATAIAKTLLDWNCTEYETLADFEPKSQPALPSFMALEHETEDHAIKYTEA
jgi:N-acetylmuramoyl-L-alanine amidase